MRLSVSVAKPFGIDVRVHVTLLGVVALSAWRWERFGEAGLAFGALSSIALFTCIALHELGHSVVAQAVGMTVREILLFPLGGVAQLEGLPKRPWHELVIAVAGPAVNVVIAGALWWGFVDSRADGRALWRAWTEPGPTPASFVAGLLVSNVFLALFNLLPAFPMDGGRVLRAALTPLLGAERATTVAALLGRVLAVGLVAAGVALGDVLTVVLAVFVVFAGREEEVLQRYLTVLRGVRVGEALPAMPHRLAPDATLADAVALAQRSPASAFAVERLGQLLAVISRADVVRLARERSEATPVLEVARRDVPTVSPDDVLERARELLHATDAPCVAVLRDGVLVGLVTEFELAHQVDVAAKLVRR